MDSTWNILYRGSLTSCNYSCHYCPFAKTKNTREELAIDAQQLLQFQNWVNGRKEKIGILFTPWGEGLIRNYYQMAMTALSHMPNVYRVAIQTNLSCSLDWVDEVNKDSFALWTTYHPSQLSLDSFLEKCEALVEKGIRFSIGTVGLKEDIEIISQLRKRLPSSVYLWVNAYKREADYYNSDHLKQLLEVDPLFHWNNQYHQSKEKACDAGSTSFSVDGDGNMTSCHFIKEKIGNIYQENFEEALYPRLCSNTTCGCHIGYVHLKELEQKKIYGKGLLERIPIHL
ncbi:STM4011 family radical SAM protein [Flammeovirga aprica]|uniref:Radical SAM protein n=1 Tax=Flammeovirga aprica JL-4 TaxID=694437 RepID=A0A7X9RVG2_9BACT|nr:STM4011 family radical SAM protein [Flammeovirga aprica]NME69450.1 radical SAM protein [Flammeovirga aprica JL-4]